MMKVCFSKVLFLVLFVVICAQAFARGGGQEAKKKSPDPAAAASVTDTKSDAKKDCGCEIKVPPDVLATVNGVKVSTAEVEEAIKSDADEIQKQMVDARQHELDLEINSILLDAEAKRRGIQTSALVQQEIVAKTPKPTEADAQDYYNKNKDKIGADFNAVKENIIAYLLNQKQQDRAVEYAKSLRMTANIQVMVKDMPPATTPAERAVVLATVNGQKVTAGQVEDDLKPVIADAKDEMYKLHKAALDLKINDILLGQQADKEKITSKALLDREVTSKVKPVTDADAQNFYDKNKDRIQGNYEDLKPKIVEYLQQQEEQKLETAYATELRKTASIQVFLKPPEPAVYVIATEGRPFKGPENAAVTVVEFTDFQCPSCGKEEPIMQKLIAEYSDRVRFVIVNFPLEMHENAFRAALAAEAAREQGKYWEYTDVLFHNQTALGVDKLKEYATQVGLNRQKFDASLDSNKYVATVQRDIQDGMKAGVNSTPSVFINGVKMSDRTYEGLKAVIDQELKQVANK